MSTPGFCSAATAPSSEQLSKASQAKIAELTARLSGQTVAPVPPLEAGLSSYSEALTVRILALFYRHRLLPAL